MIELAQHIEALLLENDCVIIPGFGGFVAHLTPAVSVEEGNVFIPPIRTIGFNPQLRLNDGLLVQSYMAVYDTDFSDATKIVEEKVAELVALLHNEGRADLQNIGELRYTIHDTYEFISYEDRITTPYLYGLGSFEMRKLSVSRLVDTKVLEPIIQKRKKSYEIRVNRAFLRNAVAAVAAVALFFLLSTPIENTYIERNNYAQLLSLDLFETIENRSVAFTPVKLTNEFQQKVKRTIKKHNAKAAVVAKPIAVKEVKVSKPVVTELKKENLQVQVKETNQIKKTENHFYIIVAGGIAMKDAEKMAQQLNSKGFTDAKVLDYDGKIRVSILSCSTREEANKQLLKFRENASYKNAWLLTK